MTLLKYDENLTDRPTDLQRSMNVTHQGQAHFAGTGPKGRTCRECVHWGCGQVDYYAASNKTHGPTLKPAPCAEFKRRMNGREGAKVPHSASACSAFTPSEKPPAISRRT